MQDVNQLIVIEQLPIITERLRAMSESVAAEVKNALALECTEETVKQVKAARSELNNTFAELEDRRKAVKKAVMGPYDNFEAVYKECVSDQFRNADNTLKSRIDEVENELKERKRQEVKAYFDEYLASKHIDFPKLEAANINVTLSASLKSLKEQAKMFIDRVCDDLSLIETQEHKPEILVEYKKTLNCSQAITTVKTRFEAIEREKQRQAELAEIKKAADEAAWKVHKATKAQVAAMPEPLEPPKAVVPDASPASEDPVKTLAFKVTAPISALKELKKFLDDGGYQYE